MQGWFKIHRKLLESAVFAKPEILKVWIYCLAKACHKKAHFPIKTGKGETIVTLERGQLIWGRLVDGKKLRMPPSSAERYLKKLKAFDCVEIKPYSHYSIITVLNYNDYQGVTDTSEQATNNQRTGNEQPMNNQWAGNEQAMNTYKNVNKEKKEENVKNEKNIENSTPEKKEGLSEEDYFIDGIPLYKKANEVFLNYMATNQSDNLNDILKKHEITRDEFENIISKVFESKTAKIWELNDVIKNPYKYVGKAEYWVRNEKTFNPKKKPANNKKTWAENQNDVANIDWTKIYNANKNQ